MRRRRWVQAAVIAAVLVAAGRWLAVTTANSLWADAVGVGASHGEIARLRLLLLGTAVSAALLWCLGNLFIVYRSIGSVHVPRRLANIEILEAVPRRYLLALALAIGAVLALILSHGAGDWWRVRALAGVTTVVGISDPILGRDLGYYLFQLPWHRALHTHATLLSGILLAVVAVLYAAVGAIRWAERRLRVTELARAHLGMMLAAFALALAWGYRLEPAEYVAGIHAVPLDGVLTDVRIPVSRLLSALAFVAAGASLLWTWAGRPAVVIVAWIVLAIASFAGHYAVPAFAAATRPAGALALDAVEERAGEFAALALGRIPEAAAVRAPLAAQPEEMVRHQERLARAPVWDPFALTVALDRVAPPQPHTAFHEVALSAYPGAANGTPVYLGVRRIDFTAAQGPDPPLSWAAVHTGPYAFATGVVAVLAHRVSADGLPLFVRDLAAPEVAMPEPVDLALDERRVVFAPGIADFAALPAGEGPSYAGVPVGGLWRRLALAWVLQSPQLVSSDALHAGSVLLWERDVAGRLARFAPFASFGTPYPVVAEGRLQWLAEGYVAADAFPLAPRVRWRGRWVRYLRSTLIGVVDAATGVTAVYVARDPDPLTAAWAELAPDIVRPATALPHPLRLHLRYPAEALAGTRDRVRETIANARGAAAAFPAVRRRDEAGDAGTAYWWFGPVPGDSVPRLRLVSTLDVGAPAEVWGLLVGTRREGEAELRVYRVAPAAALPASGELAREFAALRPDTAGVVGAVRYAFSEDAVVAFQTSYAASRQGDGAPRLVDVAVRWGGSAATGPSLPEALERAGSSEPAMGVSVELWREVARWFERMDAARRAGDWAAFGRAYEALRRLLAGPPGGP